MCKNACDPLSELFLENNLTVTTSATNLISRDSAQNTPKLTKELDVFTFEEESKDFKPQKNEHEPKNKSKDSTFFYIIHKNDGEKCLAPKKETTVALQNVPDPYETPCSTPCITATYSQFDQRGSYTKLLRRS